MTPMLKSFQKGLLGCLFLYVLLADSPPAYSQASGFLVDMANLAYAKNEYKRASLLFEKVVSGRKASADVMEKLADCYMEINDYAAAAKWYKQITYQFPLNCTDWIHYGDVLKSMAQYSQAKIAYGHVPDSLYNTVQNKISGCDSALSWIQSPAGYKVSNLAGLNTSYADWGAVWYPPYSIVFSSDSLRAHTLDRKSRISAENDHRTERPFQKIFVADSSARGLGPIKGFSPSMNYNIYHDGPVVFTADGDTAYFTLTNPGNINYPQDRKIVKVGKRTVSLSFRRLELLMCVRDKSGNWGPPNPVSFNKTNEYSVGLAALSRDGRILYFTSDMPGGYGKTDIWYVERQSDGTWSAPINCGPMINTADEEAYPTIGVDGTFYFASKGHVGMGGYDIFKATGSGKTWQNPINLQYPINSSGDDFYFTTKDSVSGFLSSNRPGGKGGDDIYVFMEVPAAPGQPPFRVILLRTTVVDQRSGEPIKGATVVLTHLKRDARWTDFTDENGNHHQVLEGEAHYTDSAYKAGYSGAVTHVSTAGIKGSDTLSVRLYLSKNPIAGDVFVLKNLYYDFDKSNIRPDAARELDRLIAYMGQYPHMVIFFSSHTDSRGNDGYNMALSERRAQAAKQYLLRHGVAPERLTVRGFGESRLVNGCSNGVPCSAAQHQANRRTEIKILHP